MCKASGEWNLFSLDESMRRKMTGVTVVGAGATGGGTHQLSQP